MTSLNKRMRPGGSPSVTKLFARSQNARTVMDGPSMMKVLGMQRTNAVAALSGFAGTSFGALPDFGTLPMPARGQSIYNQVRGDLDPRILRARQIQTDISAAEQRPEAAQLIASARALEESITSQWNALVGAAAAYGARQDDLAAMQSKQRSYTRNGRTFNWTGAPGACPAGPGAPPCILDAVDYAGRPQQFDWNDYNKIQAEYMAELNDVQGRILAAEQLVAQAKN